MSKSRIKVISNFQVVLQLQTNGAKPTSVYDYCHAMLETSLKAGGELIYTIQGMLQVKLYLLEVLKPSSKKMVRRKINVVCNFLRNIM